MGEPSPGTSPPSLIPPEDRLDSWKEIAAYLRRDVTTVQRWEKREGMPVHRHLHDRAGSLYAFRSELDAWVQSRRLLSEQEEKEREPSAETQVASERDHGPKGATRPSRWFVLVGVVVLFLLAVTLILTRRLLRPSAIAPEPRMTVVPLSTYPGYQVHPSFSPDGNQVAFVWNGEKQDHFDIYVKLIGTVGPPLRLTKYPAGGSSPAWSPDGRFIAFLRWISDDKCALFLMPALGGPEREITETSGVLFPNAKLAWSPDGSSLAFSDRDSPTGLFALYLVSIETGERRKLTSPSAPSVGDVAPAFAPDGRTLAFSRRVDLWGSRGDLYVVPFSKTPVPIAEPKRVTFDNHGATYPAWSAHGREIVFADSRGLWKIAAPGFKGKAAEPQRLSFAGNGQNSTVYEYSDPDISRRGQRLAYRHDLIHSSIWRLSAPILNRISGAHGSNHLKDIQSARFIASSRDDSQPQFSPDGKKIVFSSNRSGNMEIWVCDVETSNPVQLTSFQGANVTTPRWSPDSGRIVFDSDAEGQFDVWVISASGGKPKRLTTDPANDGNPSWSRDGRWIYFDSARTGEQQIWKLPADGGEPMQVTRDGGWAPVESPDGKFLYYVKFIAYTDLWRISLQNRQPAKVLEGLSSYANWAITDKGIYFVPTRTAPERSSIRFLQFATNSIRTIVSLERPLNWEELGGLALSPDGRSILYTQFDQAGSELMLVENFH